MTASWPLHRSVALVAGALVVCAPSVAAHESGIAGGGLLPLPIALAAVTSAGLLAGVVTAIGRGRSMAATGSRLVDRTVGTLLVGIGVWAAYSVVVSSPVLGTGGALVGLCGGVLGTTRGRCGDVAIGAIAVHRFLEGVALAALSVSDSAVGVAGIAVLSAHTVAECVVVGGQPTRSRPRAIGAVLVIAVAFVAGAGFGAVGVVAVPRVLRMAAVSVVGGLLFAVGLAESRSTVRSEPDAGTLF